MATHTDPNWALALLEIGNLAPALLVADRVVKAANVRILGIESADSAAQCIKFVGSSSHVRSAGELGLALGRRMGTSAELIVMAAPNEATRILAASPPVYSPLLEIYDSRVPREDFDPMEKNNSNAIGLLETQGLVAALHATDEMLKGAAVSLVGKEKIGAAYVTIIIRGDVAAVQSAIESGKQAVERLGGKLILADVIARPHAELAALLPK